MTAIGANSEHPEAAMRLYNAVFTDTKLYNMLVFGVEGVHYTDLGDGYVEPIQENAYGLPAWQFGSQFNAYLLPGQSETVWEDTIAFDEAAYTTSLFGFTFDPSPVRNEATACASIYVENRPSVIHAEDFDAAMSDFVQALEDAGIQKVMDEAQRQINAWWASK
jgi:putative aldouronate transport system substrate-binding protein